MCFFADIAEPLLFAVVRERRITALLDDSEPISVLKKGGMGCPCVAKSLAITCTHRMRVFVLEK
jgi:hypothetical protein